MILILDLDLEGIVVVVIYYKVLAAVGEVVMLYPVVEGFVEWVLLLICCLFEWWMGMFFCG